MRQQKVKIVFECSPDDRSFIKALAAKKQMTLADLFLSSLRKNMPKIPNAETIQAIEDMENGIGVTHCKDLKEFWESLGIDPDA